MRKQEIISLTKQYDDEKIPKVNDVINKQCNKLKRRVNNEKHKKEWKNFYDLLEKAT